MVATSTSLKGKRAWAEWYLNDVQGEYRLSVKYPKGKNGAEREATARIRFEVMEKRPGGTSYTTVKTYTTNQQDYIHTDSRWWGWTDHIIVDGKVKVRATVLSGYAGVIDIKLTHKGILPEHWVSVRTVCLTHGLAKDKVVSDFLERNSLRSPLLGDAIEDDLPQGGDAHATPRSVLYELLFKAAVRILEEVNASGAEARAERIEEQCMERDGSWHFTGLGWTYYEGWGHAARLIAWMTHQRGKHQGCNSIAVLGGTLDTGCLDAIRRWE